MRNLIKRILAGYLTLILAVSFVLLLYFTADDIRKVPQTSGQIVQTEYIFDEETEQTNAVKRTYAFGEQITGVRINDLTDLGALTKVNYVPDKFVMPTQIIPEETKIVDLTKDFTFADRGTLFFIVMNVDPNAENFNELSNELNKYKNGDYWNFSVTLPQIFSASNVYLNSEVVAKNGTIKDYDFIDFTTNDTQKTDEYTQSTQNVQIDMRFYTRRTAIAPDSLHSGAVITIHYQSSGGAFSGISGIPLIGTANAVSKVDRRSRGALFGAEIFSIVVFTVLIVLSVLKRTGEFIPEITIGLGAIFACLSKYYGITATAIPLFWVGLGKAALFLLLCAAIFSVGKCVRPTPLRHVATIVIGFGSVLAFLLPFLPVDAFEIINVIVSILKYAATFILLTFTVLFIIRDDEEYSTLKIICAVLIATLTGASLLVPSTAFLFSYSPLWLYGAVIVSAFALVFKIFIDTERRNSYMTTHLHLEVARQTQDIRAVIDERDRLLQFLSHDLKKPLSSSETFLNTLLQREKDPEQTKALNIVKQNTDKVIASLSEIASYAHYNYVAEPSQAVNLEALCKMLHKYCAPDCEAGGILLHNLVTKPVKAFAKRQGLENALSNIILNAIEHADCTQITLSVRRTRGKVSLSVTDNGKGVDPHLDVLKPYVSENEDESGGLGLYICNSIIQSMNGTLSYESKQGKTVFTVTLLKA